MKYGVLVILNPPVPTLREKVTERMRPFEIDWDDPTPAIRSRWDWYIFPKDGPFNDPEVRDLVGGFEALNCVCRISHLPPGYSVSAAITPDGTWHDLQDFGWRLVDEDSPRNKEALTKWESHFRDVVARHQHAVGVELYCHG